MGFFTRELSPADWRAILQHADHQGIHNFSFGCCAAYFGLLSGRPSWSDEGVLHIVSAQGRHKTWVFDLGSAEAHVLTTMQSLGPIYSQKELALPGQSQFREVSYDLDQVFDPLSYPNKKKRHQRLTYPRKWLERWDLEIQPLHRDDMSEIGELHRCWLEHKLAQPGTYQIMFPRARYYDCCRLAVTYPIWFVGFKLINQHGAILGARVLYREDEYAFDLAQFTSPNVPSNTSESFAVETMRQLRDDGVRSLNCGASLNRSLAAFKHHWPHQIISHWTYSQKKT